MADVINGNYIRSGELLEKNQIKPLFGVFVLSPPPPPGIPLIAITSPKVNQIAAGSVDSDFWLPPRGERESLLYFFYVKEKMNKTGFLSGAIKSKKLPEMPFRLRQG